MERLNQRQIILYEFLEVLGDKWTEQKDIAVSLGMYYPPFDKDKFHDSATRLLMTKDIRTINESDEVPKVIISGKRGVKLANREEFARYINRQYSSVFRRLKRIRGKERKGRLDGQSYFDHGTAIDIIDVFLHER